MVCFKYIFNNLKYIIEWVTYWLTFVEVVGFLKIVSLIKYFSIICQRKTEEKTVLVYSYKLFKLASTL